MKNYENKAIVLGVSGNGLGIVRSLGRRGINVIVVSDIDKTASLASRYITKKWFFRGTERALVDELLIKGKLFNERPVLFPVRDATVLALSHRIQEIKEYYHLVMPDSEIVEKALCKTTFSKMADEFGLLVPKSYSIKNQRDIDQLPELIKFPLIVKPEYRNDDYIANVSGKAFVAKNLDELVEIYEKFSQFQPEAIVQEYIPGNDSDLYFCFQYYTKGQMLAVSLCGRKIRQYPPSCGSTSSCEVVLSPEIDEMTTTFFKKIGYVGPCSMEFKRDSKDGRFYLIEPTVGRVDWNNAFAEGNGFPIPYLNFLDALGLPLPECRQNKIHRRWIRWSADIESAKILRNHGDIALWPWLWSIRPPFIGALFAFDDPLPVFIHYYNRVKRKSTSMVNKFFKTVKKTIRKIYLSEKYIIYNKKIDLDNLPEISDKFIFREATVNDISEVIRSFKPHYNDSDRSSLLERINSGEFLIIGYVKGKPDKLCMFSWLSEKNPFFIEERKINNSIGTICNCRSFVLETYRNMGASFNSKLYIEHFVFERNYKELAFYVRSNNWPQLKVAGRAKWIKNGILYRKMVLGKQTIKVELN